MLEISPVSALDNAKITLTPFQLIFYYKWLQSLLSNSYTIISSEIDADKKVTSEKDYFSNTVLSISQHKRLDLAKYFILILNKWTVEQNLAFCEKFYIEILPFVKKRRVDYF